MLVRNIFTNKCKNLCYFMEYIVLQFNLPKDFLDQTLKILIIVYRN